jgi:Insertion element 4 transposase N-terminal
LGLFRSLVVTSDVADRPVVGPDQVTLGVLISQVSREEVDAAIEVCGVREKRSDGKLPAHVTAYLTLALALFADDDYEEVATKVTGSLVRVLERGLDGAYVQRCQPGPETVGS